MYVVMQLLAEHDVHVDAKDNEGQTPLPWAAEHGHYSVVSLLLEHPEIDPNSNDDWGWTPLAWAAWLGHEAVVKYCLKTAGFSLTPRTTSAVGLPYL